MYDVSSLVIAGTLFVSMLVVIELGYRFGLRAQARVNEAFKTHVNAITGSLLGILALLLGFTFSLALQRFDSRSEAVVDEANAIGTAYLRSELLPESLRGEVQSQLRAYLDLRIRASSTALIRGDTRSAELEEAMRIQASLWSLARQAAEEQPNPVTSGLFVQALNELIDNFGKRVAALNRHVPEVVLMLLYGTFLMVGLIVGYGSGVSGFRQSLATYMMVGLIVVLVFIIVDLDRPRRGLIQVDQHSLLELKASIDAARVRP